MYCEAMILLSVSNSFQLAAAKTIQPKTVWIINVLMSLNCALYMQLDDCVIHINLKLQSQYIIG